VGVVNEAVEDGVGEGWIADNLAPSLDRNLTGDNRRSTLSRISRESRCSALWSADRPQSVTERAFIETARQQAASTRAAHKFASGRRCPGRSESPAEGGGERPDRFAQGGGREGPTFSAQSATRAGFHAARHL
jgi:hypothetical protein